MEIVTPKALMIEDTPKHCMNGVTQSKYLQEINLWKEKGIRLKKTCAELIVGKYIQIEQIPEYLKLALIGRFYGKTLGRDTLLQWMESNWTERMGYTLEFHVLL